MRLLNKAIRKLTENSFIGVEGRNWKIKSPKCWMCSYTVEQLRAMAKGADTITMQIERFIRKHCVDHTPYKQLRVFFSSLPSRFLNKKIDFYFECVPDSEYCSRLNVYLEISGIKTHCKFRNLYHLDYFKNKWQYVNYDFDNRKC